MPLTGAIVVAFWCAIVAGSSGRFWGEWSSWSECSRTCDGGAKYQTRRCSRLRSQRLPCNGEGIRYLTCNNKPCPPGVPDFRSEQCAAYDDASYSGRYFRWLPHHVPDNPCALSCVAEGTKMNVILAPKVLDGTRCDTNAFDMCINGRCMQVGCDRVLESTLVVDQCGVCGGDNSTCSHSNREESSRYRWIMTDFGPCSVTCGMGVKDRRLLCFDTVLGKVVDSANCENIIPRLDTYDKCRTGLCPPEWRVGPWQNCTRDCGGGVSWRIVTCVQTFDDGTQQLMQDGSCDEYKRPSSRKSCNGFICPTWYAGEWSVCSVSCGTGIQKREVICRHVGEAYCQEVDQPRLVKNCTTGVSCYNLNSDIQERHVSQFQSHMVNQMPQGDQAITKADLYQPRFVTTTWDSCSTSCGPGLRFRYVRCQVYLPLLGEIVDLPDEDCSETKPIEHESCTIEPCYDQFEWEPDGMTECSRTCLGGIQETITKCISKITRVTVNASYCMEAPHIQIERRICNDKPCPQRWELGEFGGCSKTCGGGLKTRSVTCIQEFAQGPNWLTLPDVMCSRPIPDRDVPCNTENCPANWVVSNWSGCSVTCGFGVQTRRQLCQRVSTSGIINVSRSECNPSLAPDAEKTCNGTACPEPMIKARHIKFYQLNKMKKINLIAGMKASILPETTVILKCPNVGLDRQKTNWFKNGLKFRSTSRAKVAKSGALKIRRAMLGTDDAVYSCFIGGFESNVTISFSSSYDILQGAVEREAYMSGSSSKNNKSLFNKTVLYMDPTDRSTKPLLLIPTDWTRCSMTCGGGLQSRNLSCELITHSHYLILPKSECEKHFTVKPAMIQSCNINPCVRWRAEAWSNCLDTDCVRNMYAKQRRAVDCVNEFNNTVTSKVFCSDLGFPPDNVKECYNPKCAAKWQTSEWSECVSECDDVGYNTRMLSCVFTHTGLPALQGSCDMLEQPSTTKKCQGKPCASIVCEDKSDYCSIVKQMNICHLSNFKTRCCWTCTETDNNDEAISSR